jgi:GT2 family glycosyltransferase
MRAGMLREPVATKNPPRTAVVLVNWNGWRDCVECLDSLLALVQDGDHVFLVDNDSTDQSIENVMTWCRSPVRDPRWRGFQNVGHFSAAGVAVGFRLVEAPDAALAEPPEDCRLTLIRAGGNLGFAAGNNVGMRAAGVSNFEYFWLLNTDTVVDRFALEALVARASLKPDLGMVGSTLRYYDNPERVQALGGGQLNPSTTAMRHIGEHSSSCDIPADRKSVV